MINVIDIENQNTQNVIIFEGNDPISSDYAISQTSSIKPNIDKNAAYDRVNLVNKLSPSQLRLNFKRLRRKNERKMIILISVLVTVVVAICAYLLFPVVFMLSKKLQRLLVFTNFNLPTSREYYSSFKILGLRNLYASVKSGNLNITLGVWHFLPNALDSSNDEFSNLLRKSDYPVMIYFHGSGQSRSYFIDRYGVFRQYFHVIALDYRSFADSTIAEMTENNIIADCLELYKWVKAKTTSPIYVWGHSLGTGICTEVVSSLFSLKMPIKGLILESAFTSLLEEAPHHPFGKWFSWMPWFQATIIRALRKNNLTFDSEANIMNVQCPIMFLHAEDDDVVPYSLGVKLYHIALNRNRAKLDEFYGFDASLGYGHDGIYKDPRLPNYIGKFIEKCNL